MCSFEVKWSKLRDPVSPHMIQMDHGDETDELFLMMMMTMVIVIVIMMITGPSGPNVAEQFQLPQILLLVPSPIPSPGYDSDHRYDDV